MHEYCSCSINFIVTNGVEMKGAGPTKKNEMPLIRKPLMMNFLVPYRHSTNSKIVQTMFVTYKFVRQSANYKSKQEIHASNYYKHETYVELVHPKL